MGTCLACGFESPPGARFCAHCGTAMAFVCERCGATLPSDALFCPTCGAPVAEAPPTGEERKVVTILFADVAGSTGLGERLDPERLKDVMGSYFEAMRRAIEAEGGTVEKFIGDAVMAVFGVPAAHEDDPSRALRAAVRMSEALDALNASLQDDYGVTLAIRIGVNTGEVVAATAPLPGEAMVTGDAVNVAARLEEAADPGQTLVAERTARAAQAVRLRGHPFAWLETREVGPLALKGKTESVRAFELVRVEGGVEAELGPLLAPLVGREREMALLRTLYERVTGERRPHLVTIYGDAGVGKTRLVEEFAAWAASLPEPPQMVRGRCLPSGEGVTYWPLAEILKSHSEVLDTHGPELALERIRAVTAKLLAEAGGHSDPEATAGALAFTVGLDPGAPFTEEDPRQVRARSHEAWRTYFSARALRTPIVVVVEDIHWADPALLDLVEELAERAQGALLFVCPSRPELTVRRPGWGGGRWNFSGVLLEPLTEGEARILLELLVGDEDVPSGLRERILERAGGNPFFLEEIIRHLMDERRVVAEAEGVAPAEPWRIEIPDTVQGVLAARMDLLGVAEKRALQSAAVVGRTFWTGPVQRLVGADPARLESALAGLEDRGLVVARVGSSIEGDREYVFRHVLTRDVAYESLPRRERAAAHAEVASWIEQRAGERHREFADLLAHHYVEAYRGILAETRSDPGRVEELRRPALRFALLASNEAWSKLALDRAKQFAETALSLASGGLERSGALEALGRAYLHDFMGDLAWQCLKEAVDLRVADAGGDRRDLAGLCALTLEVATRRKGAMRSRVSEADAEPYLRLGSEVAGEEDSEALARLLVVRVFWPWCFPDQEASEEANAEALRAGERAEAMARRLGRPDLVSAALDGMGVHYLYSGRYGGMEPIVRRRVELAASLVDPWELGDIYAVASWWAEHMGRYREALEFADLGVDRTLAGATLMALYCLDWRALTRCRLGDWDGFFADAELADDLLGDRRDRPPGFVTDHVAAGAFLREVRGDQAMADRLLQLVDWLERNEEQPVTGWTLWRVRLLARRGQFDEAWALLERPEVQVVAYGRDELLEARCELVAAQGAWDRAAAVAEEARRHAGWSGVLALPAFADRLEGRAAMAGGDAGAVRLLSSAHARFGELEAAWEAAVTGLDLAEAHAGEGSRGRADARRVLSEAVPILDRARSVAELARAGGLLEALG